MRPVIFSVQARSAMFQMAFTHVCITPLFEGNLETMWCARVVEARGWIGRAPWTS